jgi:hypothetical protein
MHHQNATTVFTYIRENDESTEQSQQENEKGTNSLNICLFWKHLRQDAKHHIHADCITYEQSDVRQESSRGWGKTDQPIKRNTERNNLKGTLRRANG